MESAEDQVTKLCKELNIPEPIQFLTNMMGGIDPRRVSIVYLKIQALEEEYGNEPPDAWDWMDLVELIKQEYRGSIIEIGKSQDAAKQLLEYMHPKRKAMDIVTTHKTITDIPLSKNEVKRIRKQFDLDY